MRSLFVRTLLYFIGTILVSTATIVGFLFAGFKTSADDWEAAKRNELERVAASVVRNPSLAREVLVPDDTPVFVYSADMDLLYSNRGAGRHRQSGEPNQVEPIVIDSEVAGYYHVGSIRFQNDIANERFFKTLTATTSWGALVSCVVSVVAALLFTRSLSRPAQLVSRGIDAMSHGDLRSTIPEPGTHEMARIARSANNLRGRLLREQELRAQWAQDIAHDLRTPVSALKAQLEGMRDGVLPPTPERASQNLVEIERVGKLINDLEELMKLETPDLVLEPSNFELRSFVESLSSAFKLRAQERNVAIESNAETRTVRGDPDLLYRAASNVLSNAVRHAEAGSTVDVHADVSDGIVALSIRNQGEPIAADELPRLFDRLYRGERARSTRGSGLGLTIARQILELHGGSIAAASDRETGTVFSLRFPAD